MKNLGEHFADVMENYLFECDNIEDVHCYALSSGDVEIAFAMRNAYFPEVVISFNIECEPDMDDFLDRFNGQLDCVDINEIAIDIIRQESYDGLVTETYAQVKETYDDLCDFYDKITDDKEKIEQDVIDLIDYQPNINLDYPVVIENDFVKDLVQEIFEQVYDGPYRREGTLSKDKIPSFTELREQFDMEMKDIKYYLTACAYIDALPEKFKMYSPDYENKEYLELSDNHTFWEIDNEDFNMDDYNYIVDDAISEFSFRTDEELYLLGRSGRHACVDFTVENLLNYEALQEIQREIEENVIVEANEIGKEDVNRDDDER